MAGAGATGSKGSRAHAAYDSLVEPRLNWDRDREPCQD